MPHSAPQLFREQWQVPLATLMLAFSGVLISGHFSVFWDSSQYLRQGEYLATSLHLASPLADPEIPQIANAVSPDAIAKFGPLFTTTAASRSPFYGFVLFMLSGLGGMLPVALVQSACAAWILWVATRLVIPGSRTTSFFALVAVLSVGSSLPFFAGFAMPDVFCGLALLAVVLILIGHDRLRRGEQVGLWAVLTLSMLFHRSNAVLTCGMVLSAIISVSWAGHWRKVAARSGVVACALVTTVGVTHLVQESYRRTTGFSQGSLPFLISRMLVDGPGKSYLTAHCPGGASPTLCAFKDQRADSVGDVLFRVETGIFGSADYNTRLQLQRDELAFAASVLAFDPVGSAKAALANWWEQLGTYMTAEPLVDPARAKGNRFFDGPALDRLEPGLTPCMEMDGCERIPFSRLGTSVFDVHRLVILASLAVLLLCVYLLRRSILEGSSAERAYAGASLRAGYLILVGVVLNAAVCGIISGPEPRFQARVIWLIPMAAVLGLLAVRQARFLRASSDRRV